MLRLLKTASASSFSGNGGGHIDYTLINDNENYVSVKVVVYDWVQMTAKKGQLRKRMFPDQGLMEASKLLTQWLESYDSPRTKYVYVKVYDNDKMKLMALK